MNGFAIGGRTARRQLDLNYLLIVVVFVVSAAYAAYYLKRSWAPEDEGTLALPALSVLHGEIPHRDFDDVYTGGEAFVNAAAFRIFGLRLVSMRYMLYLFFLAWIPTFYYAASRFMSSAASAALTLLSVVWTIPNYPAAMPSWYNLFFATFGLAALLRYLEIRRARWLFMAGLCGGVSVLFKVSGLYFVAGAFLSLLFCKRFPNEHHLRRTDTKYGLSLVVIAMVLAYEVILLRLILKDGGIATVGYFVIPGLLIGAVIVLRELSQATCRRRRSGHVIDEIMPLMSGALLPIVLFLTLYVPTGSVPEFVQGVFVLPQKRFVYAVFSPSTLRFLGGFGLDIIVIAGLFWTPSKVRKWLQAVFLLSLAVVLYLARVIPNIFRATWSMLWCLAPIVVIAGVLILVARQMGTRHMEVACDEHRLFLALAVMANCSLIQFPYTSAEYFLYIAPLVALAAAAVISCLERPPYPLLLGVLSFVVLFMVLDCTPGWLLSLGDVYHPDRQTAQLAIPIARGLRVDPESAKIYEKLGDIIHQHARGQYIIAAPDCPEVYLLFGYRNPTRTLWDFISEPANRSKEILAAIKERDINLVVIRRKPFVSPPIPRDLKDTIDREFPNHEAVWFFDVRWRD